MGVTGLWQVLSPAGRPVTLQSLEGKTLAVDISVWLHQALKGTAAHRNDVKNPHLVTLFHRLAKLLFYGVRPIVVFDGPNIPTFKRQTLRERRMKRDVATNKVGEVHKKILSNYLKSQALNEASGSKGKTPIKLPKSNDLESDEYLLPEIDYENLQNSDESEVEDENDWEIDTDYSQLDMEVVRQLPTDIQTEIAEQLKEKSNFTDPDDLPENLDEFSQFQLEKLLQKTRVKQQLRSALNETNHGNKEDILLALDDANGGEQKKFTNSLMDRYKNAELKVEMGRNSSDSKSGFVLIKKKPDQVPFRASKTASFPVESSSQPAVDNTSSKTAAIGASEDLNRSFLSDDEEQSDEESEIQLKKVVEKTTSPYFESNKIECENLSSSSDEDDFIDVDMKVPEKNFIPIFVPSTHATFENNLDEITDHPSTSKLVRTSSPYSFITMKHIDEAKIKNIEMAVVSTVDVVEARPTDVVEVKPNDVVKVKPTGMTEVKPTDVVEVKSIDMVEVKSTDVVEVKPIDTAYVEVDKVNCIDVQNENELIEDESETGKEKLPSDSQFENVDQSEFTESVMSQSVEAMHEQLDAELEDLRKLEKSEEAKTKTMTEQIYDDCQNLLRLMGVPYMISPGEAEAQCAWLDRNNVTVGSVTEDSDVWLFGGRRVYRHVFNREMSGVEFYKLEEFTNLLGLTRNDLVLMAMMTGCDYTSGIEGIGPVTAVEVLSEFKLKSPLDSPMKVLLDFKNWWDKRQKLLKESPIRMRIKKLNLKFPNGFPNEQIFEAFIAPEVDSSTEKFSWGKPDLGELRSFASSRMGWPEKKTDEIIGPILKKMNDAIGFQTKLTSFTMSIQKETNRKPSKRLKQAVSKLLQPDHSNVPECSTSAAAAKIIKGKTHQKKKSNPSDEPAKEANKVTKKIATKRRAQTNRLAKKKATAKLATVCQISSSESEEEENHTQMCNS